MLTRLAINYAGGSVELTSGHGNALRDVLRLLARIKESEDRTIPLIDNDGTVHHVNLARVDRVDFSWEPSADAATPDLRRADHAPAA